MIWEAARVALEELEQRRGREPLAGEYAAACHKAVWEAAFSAAADAASEIVRQAHPEGSWAANNPAPKPPRVHVIHSGPGSGKSTAAKAFMVGLVRAAQHHRFPIGCALLVHHVETADKAYSELSALLPDNTVAVWTSEHDAASPVPAREPRFSVEELEDYPVIVVTHEFFRGVRGDRARRFRRHGLELSRVVTFVDEKVNEVETYSLVQSNLDHVIEHVEVDDQAPAALRNGLMLLDQFVRQRKHGERNLETPLHDDQWHIAFDLQWFGTEEASLYARTHMASLQHKRRGNASPKDIEMVFGFARCMVAVQAFIKRSNKGLQGARFVGYERSFPELPGMVLLDATAEIDGVTELCPWRQHHKTRPERYDNLEITQVPSVVEGTLSKWLDHEANRTTYARHILQTVLEHVRPGQRALIVCKQDIVVARPTINGWSKHMELFTTKKPVGPAAEGEKREGFPWQYQGRSLGLTWWGGYGIGANDWQDADVVLLFDQFHLPGYTVAAMTQGLMSANATEPPLSEMLDTRSRPAPVKTIEVGHLLRWTRQMALRGKARQFDDTGRCGMQKLVVVGDDLFLVEHSARLFPGAKVAYADTGEGSLLQRLISVLRTAPLPDTVKAVEVGKLLGVVWGDVTSNLVKHARFKPLLAGIGWTYVPGRGRGGSRFDRTTGEAEARSPTGITTQELEAS
jgi:hypothetical protein